MDNNPELPEGWAMPDYMAKRIYEVLNNKPTSPEDELADALDDMARDIALIEPNPVDWAGWVSYLLELMEEEAKRRVKQLEYKIMLKSLLEDIESRIKGGT